MGGWYDVGRLVSTTIGDDPDFVSHLNRPNTGQKREGWVVAKPWLIQGSNWANLVYGSYLEVFIGGMAVGAWYGLDRLVGKSANDRQRPGYCYTR